MLDREATQKEGSLGDFAIRLPIYDRPVPSGDPKHPLTFPFGDLTDDEFDELVYLLAHSVDPKVAKLRAPDGGLDTVRLSDSDPLTAAWGIQAKRHRQHIKWPSCKESLDRATSIWRPPAVTFAFPRDLTEPQHKLFHKHLTGRHAHVKVDWWGSTKLTALLIGSPTGRGIAKRFFHAEDPADLADRAIRAGKPLRTATDLLDREELTGDLLQSADPHFSWVATKRVRADSPVPVAPGTALRLEFGNGEQELVFDAIPRSGSTSEHFGPSSTISFPNEAEWQSAQTLIEAVESHGGRADLGPAAIRLHNVPAPFDELFQRDVRGDVSIRAKRKAHPWPARLSADTDEGQGAVDIDLLPVEPEDEWDARLTGQRHGLTVDLRFVWSHSKRSGELNVAWSLGRPTGSASDRASVLGLLIAVHGTGTLEISDRENHREPLARPTNPAPVPEDLRHLHRVYTDLAAVQAFSSARFQIPDEIPYDQAYNLAVLAQWIRDGGYDATLSSLKCQCDPDGLAAIKSSGSDIEIRETLFANVFGGDFPIATRSIALPPMVLKHATRLPGSAPVWKAELVPLAGEAVPVRFHLEKLDPAHADRAA